MGFTVFVALVVRSKRATEGHEIERQRMYRGLSAARARLPFATTTYEADKDGTLRSVLPSRCVFATGAETCSMFVGHYRPRKSGPRFPIAVVGCSAHPHGRYTLYPPGHVPYGREPAVPSSPSGGLLRDAATGEPVWEATLFAAAVDAAGGERWPSDSPAGDPRRRRTQGRRLELAGRLVGVHARVAEIDDAARERIATRLGVPTLTLRTAAREWAASWARRGAAVLAVLLIVPVDGALLDRILAAGALGGLWARPRRWDAVRGTWVMAPSPRSVRPERPAAARPRGRSPPPTTLRGAGP